MIFLTNRAERAAKLRAKADELRKVARTLSLEADRRTVEEHADKLERQAAALEEPRQ
jgi:hypothetical protein